MPNVISIKVSVPFASQHVERRKLEVVQGMYRPAITPIRCNELLDER